MIYDINNLPQERKMCFSYFLTTQYILPFIVMTMFFSGGLLMFFTGFGLEPPANYILWGTGGFVALAIAIVSTILISKMRKYPQIVKNGTRLFVEVAHVDEDSMVVYGIINGEEVSDKISIPHSYSRAYGRYTYIPAYYYEGRLMPDWVNIKDFGSLDAPNKGENTPQTISKENVTRAKQATNDVETNQTYQRNDLENSFRAKYLSNIFTSIIVIGILLIILGNKIVDSVLMIINQSQFDFTHTLPLIVGLYVVCQLVLTPINIIAYASYTKAFNHGERVVAQVNFYSSKTHYKANKKSVSIFNPHIKNGPVIEFTYSGLDGATYSSAFSFYSGYYNVLKDETALPAIVYKNKVYPNWAGILRYIETKENDQEQNKEEQ